MRPIPFRCVNDTFMALMTLSLASSVKFTYSMVVGVLGTKVKQLVHCVVLSLIGSGGWMGSDSAGFSGAVFLTL
jgi:hypothetical protein